MGLLRRPLSIRAGVVLQLALVATASLALLAVFALKVIEVTLQRRHVDAGISVAGVVRGAVEKEMAENPVSPNVSDGMIPGPSPPTSTKSSCCRNRRPRVVRKSSPWARRRSRSSRCMPPWT